MMKRQLVCMMSGAAILSLHGSAAEARPFHRAVHHHHQRYVRNGHLAFKASNPQDPRFGYEEAPADSSYQGPGAEVFRRTIQSAHEPGVTLELEPDAKETATGGPSGGVPSHSGGGDR